MHETPEDLEELQLVLDRSVATGGRHLRSIITADRRMSAAELSRRLTGMRLLVLATVTADGRPLAGPVDGIFYRGRFYFGSDPNSVRFRHIRRRPAVSATHLPGEDLAVTVHGRAELVDIHDPEHAEFRQSVLDIYLPRYGPEWEQWLDRGPVYARIHPDKMFTFHMEMAGQNPEAAP